MGTVAREPMGSQSANATAIMCNWNDVGRPGIRRLRCQPAAATAYATRRNCVTSPLVAPCGHTP
jgi:hypothetical protein